MSCKLLPSGPYNLLSTLEPTVVTSDDWSQNCGIRVYFFLCDPVPQLCRRVELRLETSVCGSDVTQCMHLLLTNTSRLTTTDYGRIKFCKLTGLLA
jgi:hypothetical protein